MAGEAKSDKVASPTGWTEVCRGCVVGAGGFQPPCLAFLLC